MTPEDFILDIYDSLLEAGWVMGAIDEMDIMYFLEVLAYRSRKTLKKKEKVYYADQVPKW